jgi:phosphoribosylaminoimidazole-succinocarboxamide synthase
MVNASLDTSIQSLKLLSKGKVRDMYIVDDQHLLMIATDRLSAYDVILQDPIPRKGILLNQMANFWFEYLKDIIPNHLTTIAPESVVLPSEIDQVKGRAMVVQRLQPIMVEAVVRGYLAGSGWKDYQQTGTICGVALPAGLSNAQRLAEPIFTPAAKAQVGDHDENISFAEVEKRIGSELANQIKHVSLALYQKASSYALSKGIIIADTKFEFGLDPQNRLVLMDEILTADSSRFWPESSYKVGSNPPSFDKQFVRDYLESVKIDGQPWNKKAPSPQLPAAVIEKTASKYQEALDRFLLPLVP